MDESRNRDSHRHLPTGNDLRLPRFAVEVGSGVACFETLSSQEPTPCLLMNNQRNSLITCATTLLLVVASFASPLHSTETPPVGSAERSAILDTVRAKLYRDVPGEFSLSRPVEFVVDHLKIEGEWACLSANPGYRDKKEEPAQFAVLALLKRRGGGWKLEKILYLSDVPARKELVGRRRVPASILPKWMP